MRRELVVSFDDVAEGNRDKGKKFLIVEMAAYDLEWFSIRALQALGTSGVPVSQEMVDAGAVGLLLLGYQAFMGSDEESIKRLKDEMMGCVFLQSSAEVRVPWNPQLVSEVSTLKTLREKWLYLHTGFTLAELALKLTTAISAKMIKRRRSPTT